MKYVLIISLLLVLAGAAWAADPKAECYVFQTRMIYHSPETPGYTSWVGFDKTPDNKLLCSFAQNTGKAPDIKSELVVLESSDVGRTWTKVQPDGWTGFSRIATILPDGTLVRGFWPSGDTSGYIARSSDKGKTWSKPINFIDTKVYKAWPGVIKQLRDGRLVMFAGVWKRGEMTTGSEGPRILRKMMFVSADGGKSWGKPIPLMTPEEGVCEESDFCELPNGDLFWVHRAEHYPDHDVPIPPGGARMGPNPPESYWYSDRLQSIAHKRGNTFVAGKVTRCPFPHSGYPTVLYTKEGLIMHMGTDAISWTADLGNTWHKLNNPATDYSPGTYYYPISMQMPDGEIVVIGHRGWDDVYGTVDQAIMQQTFRLKVTR